jgi:hypothetical protein
MRARRGIAAGTADAWVMAFATIASSEGLGCAAFRDALDVAVDPLEPVEYCRSDSLSLADRSARDTGACPRVRPTRVEHLHIRQVFRPAPDDRLCAAMA